MNLHFYWIKCNLKSKWSRILSICLFISQFFSSGTEQAKRELYHLFCLAFWHPMSFHTFLPSVNWKIYKFQYFQQARLQEDSLLVQHLLEMFHLLLRHSLCPFSPPGVWSLCSCPCSQTDFFLQHSGLCQHITDLN